MKSPSKLKEINLCDSCISYYTRQYPQVPLSSQFESLDDLLALAKHYAEFCMHNSGKMAPTLFLIGANWPLMFVPASLVDADEKDDFATIDPTIAV
jgi:hypothetical protein